MLLLDFVVSRQRQQTAADVRCDNRVSKGVSCRGSQLAQKWFGQFWVIFKDLGFLVTPHSWIAHLGVVCDLGDVKIEFRAGTCFRRHV